MRPAVMHLHESLIREVANAGIGRDDVLPFWFGEGDEATPEFIGQAAIASLQRGETFCAHDLGLAELRTAIARYMTSLHGPVAPRRLAVTSGGAQALMPAVQALVDAGEEVVALTPVWPNLAAQLQILGARVRCVSLTPREGAWTLDMDTLLGAVTPRTRLLILNAPSNPTGWTLSREQQAQIVAPAPGGMRAFFRLSGAGDSLATAKRLVAEAGLGLARGVAFGVSETDARGCWLRWRSSSRDPQRLVAGVERLRRWSRTGGCRPAASVGQEQFPWR